MARLEMKMFLLSTWIQTRHFYLITHERRGPTGSEPEVSCHSVFAAPGEAGWKTSVKSKASLRVSSERFVEGHLRLKVWRCPPSTCLSNIHVVLQLSVRYFFTLLNFTKLELCKTVFKLCLTKLIKGWREGVFKVFKVSKYFTIRWTNSLQHQSFLSSQKQWTSFWRAVWE